MDNLGFSGKPCKFVSEGSKTTEDFIRVLNLLIDTLNSSASTTALYLGTTYFVCRVSKFEKSSLILNEQHNNLLPPEL